MVMAKKKTTKQAIKKSSTSEQFLSMRLTRQTIYWLILSLLVVGLAIWVLQLTIQIQGIYDRVEYLNATNEMTIPTK